MNCKQFNSVKLEEILVSLGHHPTKQNEKEAWFLNPFYTETQASFKINKNLNYWYLHSEGIGGNNINFMKQYLNESVKEVLEWTEKQNFSSFQPQNVIQKQNSLNQNYQITEIKELQNENLKKYLHQRGLSQIIYPLIKEVHFTIGEKNLYTIGFENRSGGWELRNSFYKGSLLKKDISLINLNNQTENKNVAVFEGFTDALSFVEMKPFFNGDLLVMNSVSLLNRTKEYLKILLVAPANDAYKKILAITFTNKAVEEMKSRIVESLIAFTEDELSEKTLSARQNPTSHWWPGPLQRLDADVCRCQWLCH